MNTHDGDKKVLIGTPESMAYGKSINTPKNVADDKSSNTLSGSDSGDNDLGSTSEDMSDGDEKVLIATPEGMAYGRSINTRAGMSDDEKKVLIAACLAVADIIYSLKANKSTRDSIKKLFVHMNFAGIFGRKELMESMSISSTAAGNLIGKMKEAKLIEPLSGHGKGKYRFKMPDGTPDTSEGKPLP